MTCRSPNFVKNHHIGVAGSSSQLVYPYVDKTVVLHPWKLTWQWKITMFNRRYIFKWLFFCCHVSFRGSTIFNQSGSYPYPYSLVGQSSPYIWCQATHTVFLPRMALGEWNVEWHTSRFLPNVKQNFTSRCWLNQPIWEKYACWSNFSL